MEMGQGCMGGLATPDSGPGLTQEIPPADTPIPEAAPPAPNVTATPTGITQGAVSPDAAGNPSPYVYTGPANPGSIAAAAPGTQTTDEIHPGDNRSFLMVQVIPASMSGQTNPDTSLLTLDTFREPTPLVTIQRGYTANGPWQDIDHVNSDGAGRIPITFREVVFNCRIEIAGSPPPPTPADGPLTAAQASSTIHGELQRFLQFSAVYGEGGNYFQSAGVAVNCPSGNLDPSWDQRKAIPVNLTLRPQASSGLQREGVSR